MAALGRGPQRSDARARRGCRARNGSRRAMTAIETTFGLTHARQLFLAADGDDLRGEDRADRPRRPGLLPSASISIPRCRSSLTQDGNAVLLRLPGGTGWRLRAQGAVLSLAESIYLGGETPRKTRQIVLDGHVGSDGAIVKWALRREQQASSARTAATRRPRRRRRWRMRALRAGRPRAAFGFRQDRHRRSSPARSRRAASR